MELSDVQSAHFSQWVQASSANKLIREDSRVSKVSKTSNSSGSDKTISNKIYSSRAKYSDEVFRDALQRWIENPEKEETNKLKKLARQGVQTNLRCELWMDASGGGDIIHNSPHYYRELIDDLGIQVPSSIPETIFNGSRNVPTYCLSGDGKKICLKVLYILSHIHPDIQFSPLLPPLTAMFLHFMSEDQCYACMSAVANSRRSLLDQSQRAVAVMAKTFQDCLKSYFMPSYKQIKSFVQVSKGQELTKGTVLIPDWIVWMFLYIDFWTLVYIVDSFIVQGPKLLVRVGLVVFSQFAKFIEKQDVSESDDLEELFQEFASQMPLKGYKLLQNAFRIRGLSRKQLERLKSKNISLLQDGQLDVLDQTWKPLQQTLTVFTVQGSDLLSPQEWEQLCSWLPDRLRIKKPVCLFTTELDGYSVRTLYNKCEADDETIVLVKTSIGEKIGGFVTTCWSERVSGKKTLSYFGTGESFIFRLCPTPVHYRWTGLRAKRQDTNDLFMAGDDKSLMIGGGGDNAIWLDSDLCRGHSGACTTFGNEPLTEKADFQCSRVDVLGFVAEA